MWNFKILVIATVMLLLSSYVMLLLFSNRYCYVCAGKCMLHIRVKSRQIKVIQFGIISKCERDVYIE